jgi:hypothetical protein
MAMPRSASWRGRAVGLGLAVLWATCSVGADARVSAPTAAVRNQGADVTVRGCVERDAASRVPLYELLQDAPGTRVFRLTFPKDVDVPSHVGHTVDITGTVTASASGQTREPDFTVKKLTVVRETCTGFASR